MSVAADLSEADRAALRLAVTRVRDVPAHEILIDDGDRPEVVHVVLEGFACRYKLLSDGGKQIMAWLVPGDFCDLQVAVLGRMDHTIATVSASRIGAIDRAQIDVLFNTSPALSHALWWASLVQEAILREWLVGIGRRDAAGRMMHLLCELHARLTAAGLAQDDRFTFPLSQSELADTLGISPVHVNRTVQLLRHEGLIEWTRNELVFKDVARLCSLACFDPNYLHLERRRRRGAHLDGRDAS